MNHCLVNLPKHFTHDDFLSCILMIIQLGKNLDSNILLFKTLKKISLSNIAIAQSDNNEILVGLRRFDFNLWKLLEFSS